jgi:hypothetical protein
MRHAATSDTRTEPTRRVHLTVAADRLLLRLLATTTWGVWALKGGYANQLRRPQQARFTDDVDLRINAEIEHAPGMMSVAISHPLDDPFTFELAAPPQPLAGPPGGGLRFLVVARLVGEELVRFKVDVSSLDAVVGKLEKHRSDPLIERLGFPRAVFPVYPIAQQFAEKLHAYTRPRDTENTRAKDLADMIWYTTTHAFRSGALIDAARATFERRDEHPWPPTLSRPPEAWARQYGALRKEMDLEPATPGDAYEVLVAFLEPVLQGDIRLAWSPARRSWHAARPGGSG